MLIRVIKTEFVDNVVFKLTTSIINFYCPMVAMIATYARIYLQIRKRARSEVINNCSDIRPDSFSSSEPQPMRYALATHSLKNKKDKRKRKKESCSPLPQIVGCREEYPDQRPPSCEGSCDGYASIEVPTTDAARWRCNVCGAKQGNADEWTWPRVQMDEAKVRI
ncbi:uncharacterized protein CEXT_414611 [Caerostris extrusa]|uniref:Uncharacterized protein n=1 Tax=Caerostris extrusa TaxID=172846 RepID=A0AAV4VWI7_CAEEX|nr:uncharacterized protein CEXT_414611 [Caerostris extrusa]